MFEQENTGCCSGKRAYWGQGQEQGEKEEGWCSSLGREDRPVQQQRRKQAVVTI